MKAVEVAEAMADAASVTLISMVWKGRRPATGACKAYGGMGEGEDGNDGSWTCGVVGEVTDTAAVQALAAAAMFSTFSFPNERRLSHFREIIEWSST